MSTEATIGTIAQIMDKLMTYGVARDRTSDPVVRRVSLTDDEALLVFTALVELIERRNNDEPEDGDDESDDESDEM